MDKSQTKERIGKLKKLIHHYRYLYPHTIMGASLANFVALGDMSPFGVGVYHVLL